MKRFISFVLRYHLRMWEIFKIINLSTYHQRRKKPISNWRVLVTFIIINIIIIVIIYLLRSILELLILSLVFSLNKIFIINDGERFFLLRYVNIKTKKKKRRITMFALTRKKNVKKNFSTNTHIRKCIFNSLSLSLIISSHLGYKMSSLQRV